MFHSYDITAANVHGINYLHDIRLGYHDYGIIGDTGYFSAEVQLDLFETAGIRLETNFSQLCEFLLIRNYAENVDGLFTRSIGKISASAVLQHINKTNNKPVGQINYALL